MADCKCLNCLGSLAKFDQTGPAPPCDGVDYTFRAKNSNEGWHFPRFKDPRPCQKGEKELFCRNCHKLASVCSENPLYPACEPCEDWRGCVFRALAEVHQKWHPTISTKFFGVWKKFNQQPIKTTKAKVKSGRFDPTSESNSLQLSAFVMRPAGPPEVSPPGTILRDQYSSLVFIPFFFPRKSANCTDACQRCM